MLTENEIRQALHASRVLPLSLANAHGPLGLEQLAAIVAAIADSPISRVETARIRRPISLSVQTWERLERLAHATAQTNAQPVTASEVATAILEQYVASTAATPN